MDELRASRGGGGGQPYAPRSPLGVARRLLLALGLVGVSALTLAASASALIVQVGGVQLSYEAPSRHVASRTAAARGEKRLQDAARISRRTGDARKYQLLDLLGSGRGA